MIPTGIQGIGVFGRTPITPELDAALPDILNQGVLMAVDRSGSRLLIGSFRPRRMAAEAAADRAPDVHAGRRGAVHHGQLQRGARVRRPAGQRVDRGNGAGCARLAAAGHRGLAPGGPGASSRART